MKFSAVFGAFALTGQAAAWYGQLSADAYNQGEGGQISQNLYLVDYTTGSKYNGFLVGGFNACTSTECGV
ncbi:uncharacterized protein N7529_007291 [Penicillium soppii]|jgi:hypothetical protein|uniref:uncharacterized protein n=1 Tax=Penicillium soppii TaxID=69789 RepID=UPI0025483DF0|nr:uncharacterized protein N7529_007291 [Penicillium soppii]KAJ5865375.1 hypothetical protein N7529_007291 [Penicillium soppii]